MDSAVQWGLWALVMSVVMGAVVRAWRRQAARHTSDELRYPKVIAWIGGLVGGLFLAAAVAALIFAQNERWTSLVFLGFALLGGYLLWDYRQVSYTVSPEGLRYRTTFAGAGFAPWADLRAVRWSPSSKWFRLELASGPVVRVSVMVLGLERLAAALLEKAPAAIDAESRAVLEQCARGQPPSPWG